VNNLPRVSGPSQINMAEVVSETAIGIVIALATFIPPSCRRPMRMGMIEPIAAAAW
jgi:hypothetical protein